MTTPVVAILTQGAMGAGIAARLAAHGVTVLTSLDGHSAARAAAAGMRVVPLASLAQADAILSILPPDQADAIAAALAPILAAASASPPP